MRVDATRRKRKRHERGAPHKRERRKRRKKKERKKNAVAEKGNTKGILETTNVMMKMDQGALRNRKKKSEHDNE